MNIRKVLRYEISREKPQSQWQTVQYHKEKKKTKKGQILVDIALRRKRKTKQYESQ